MSDIKRDIQMTLTRQQLKDKCHTCITFAICKSNMHNAFKYDHPMETTIGYIKTIQDKCPEFKEYVDHETLNNPQSKGKTYYFMETLMQEIFG